MLEGGGHPERLRASSPLRLGDATLIAVERVHRSADHGASWAWVSGAISPVALVVRDARGVRVLDVGGGALTLEELRREVPELDGLLSSPG